VCVQSFLFERAIRALTTSEIVSERVRAKLSV